MKIKGLKAFKVLNSRAEPTIGVQVRTSRGRAWASAPSGASVGKHEVRAFPHGVDHAIELVNSKFDKLFDGIKLEEFKDLEKIESKIRIHKIGADPVVALEFALLKELAREAEKPLWKLVNPKAKKTPKLLSNVVGGGSHAYGSLDIQEVLIYSNARKFSNGALLNSRIDRKLKSKLEKEDKHFLGGRTDEGAWATSLSDVKTLKLVREVIDDEDKKVFMGIDLAASQLYERGRYEWKNYAYRKRRKSFTRSEQIEVVKDLMEDFDLKYIEDPLQEEDFSGFAELNKGNARICGDDLTTTNMGRIRKAIRNKAIDSVVIKPNQIGSVLKTMKAVNLAKRAGLKVVVSHRSGSTGDDTLAHLAKAFEADFVKIGISGGERIVKINELIKIENS